MTRKAASSPSAPPSLFPSAPPEPDRDRVLAYADFARAQAALARAVALPAPFYGLLLGPSGTGKTLLLRLLEASLDRHRVQHLYLIAQARFTPIALARLLAQALHVPARRTHAETAKALGQLLRSRLPLQRLVVSIDEAQRLSDETLEEVRVLAESELDVKHPLFSVILAGPPSLRERFDAHDLFALKRRLSLRLELTGLTKDECRPFLECRLGAPRAVRFRDDALALVFERGRGIPALVEQCASVVLLGQDGDGPIGKQVAADALDAWEGN